MSILKIIDFKSKKRFIDRVNKYEVLYLNAINELREDNAEYQNCELQIDGFKKALITGAYIPEKLLNDLAVTIHSKIALEYNSTNKVVFHLEDISKSYDEIHNKTVKRIVETEEYHKYELMINSIRRCLIRFSLANEKDAEIIVDWLIEAIYEKIAMEFETTNKLVFEYFKFA